MNFATQITEDGTQTIIHPVYSDTYHSIQGALSEARHVYINAALKSLNEPQIKVFEMGFGTGLNCLLTLYESLETGVNIDYHAIELYPVPNSVTDKLNYVEKLYSAETDIKHNFCEETLNELFKKIHTTGWGDKYHIHELFSLVKIRSSFLDATIEEDFDVVYWDAFSPDTQPELWSEEVFTKIYSSMRVGGVLTTYSAKGDVKRALRNAGFNVERMKGFGTKHHMLKAVK